MGKALNLPVIITFLIGAAPSIAQSRASLGQAKLGHLPSASDQTLRLLSPSRRPRILSVGMLKRVFACGSMRGLLFIVGSLIFLISADMNWSVQANEVSQADSKRFDALKIKYGTLVLDLSQSVKSAGNDQVRNCLALITSQAQIVGGYVGHVANLIGLASAMRDERDEFVVLYLLHDFAPQFIEPKSLSLRNSVIA
jgi:hypothetical protein